MAAPLALADSVDLTHHNQTPGRRLMQIKFGRSFTRILAPNSLKTVS